MVTILPLRASAALTSALLTLVLADALNQRPAPPEKNRLLPPDVQMGSAYLSEAPTPKGVVTAAHAQAQAVLA